MTVPKPPMPPTAESHIDNDAEKAPDLRQGAAVGSKHRTGEGSGAERSFCGTMGPPVMVDRQPAIGISHASRIWREALHEVRRSLSFRRCRHQ
jgi:hypothetical protein